MPTASPRLRLRQLHPKPYQALSAWHTTVHQACIDSGVHQLLLDLVWIRASQLNGCDFCLDLHSREARNHGESQTRLDVLPAWREAGDLFSPQERAALSLAEAMTLLPSHGVPDVVYDPAAEVFTAEQIGALIMSISVINAYNRLGVAAAAHPPQTPATPSR